MLIPAPFHAHIADGPDGGAAFWLQTADSLRIRIGVWGLEGARGTVLLFAGRTEYVEKYGRAAADLAARGYATLAIDWRGQGLAERLSGDAMLGHVGRFGDYQKDVAAVIAAATELDLPRPWHLVAHSMGGCIGLRAVMEGLPVASCVFTAPMWGINLPTGRRPAAWALGWASSSVGLGQMRAPETKRPPYVQIAPFEGNMLTGDRAMFDWMRDQLAAVPELALGGPSLRWLYQALAEMRHLAGRASPALPCLTFLGSNERIVDRQRIETRMAAWPGGRLARIEGAEHEVMMETPAIRAQVFDQAVAHFDAHRTAAAAPAKSA